MKCAVCIAVGQDSEAVTVVSGVAACDHHMSWVGFSRTVSDRVRRFHEAEREEQ